MTNKYFTEELAKNMSGKEAIEFAKEQAYKIGWIAEDLLMELRDQLKKNPKEFEIQEKFTEIMKYSLSLDITLNFILYKCEGVLDALAVIDAKKKEKSR